MHRPGLVVVAVRGDKRAHALEAARRGLGLPALAWVDWTAALEDPGAVGRAGRPGDWLRVESPGADTALWHRLAGAGGSLARVPEGAWRPGRAWAKGLAGALAAIAAAAPHLRPTHPEALGMTDKLSCQARLEAAGVPVPPAFEAPNTTTTALRAAVEARGWRRVFVKPRWGSSAAGVLAWERAGRAEQVTAPARLVDGHLHNHKRLRTFRARADVDLLLGTVIADGAVVQRWVPKATVSIAGGDRSGGAAARGQPSRPAEEADRDHGDHRPADREGPGPAQGRPDPGQGGPFDVRVLVIGGAVAHRVARVGRGPITNLHLDAARLPAEVALARLGPGVTAAVDDAARAAAAAFPGHHAVGVDVAVDVRGRPWVLECNAWGDYLPGLLHGGLDTYAWQLRDLLGPRAAA